MTITESQIKLLSYFKDNDSFDLSKDINKFKNKKDENIDKLEASLIGALNAFEKSGLVKKYTKNNDGKDNIIYTLESSLDSFPQQISCSTNVAIKISETVNQVLPLLEGNENNKSDPTNLGEGDLVALLALIESMANRLKVLEEKSN